VGAAASLLGPIPLRAPRPGDRPAPGEPPPCRPRALSFREERPAEAAQVLGPPSRPTGESKRARPSRIHRQEVPQKEYRVDATARGRSDRPSRRGGRRDPPGPKRTGAADGTDATGSPRHRRCRAEPGRLPVSSGGWTAPPGRRRPPRGPRSRRQLRLVEDRQTRRRIRVRQETPTRCRLTTTFTGWRSSGSCGACGTSGGERSAGTATVFSARNAALQRRPLSKHSDRAEPCVGGAELDPPTHRRAALSLIFPLPPPEPERLAPV